MRPFIEIPIFPQPITGLVEAGEKLRGDFKDRADRGRRSVEQMEAALANLILSLNDGPRREVVRGDSAGSERIEFDGGWLVRLGVPAELMVEANLVLAGTDVSVCEAGEATVKKCVDVGRSVGAFARLQKAGRELARRQVVIQGCRERLETEREETERRRQVLFSHVSDLVLIPAIVGDTSVFLNIEGVTPLAVVKSAEFQTKKEEDLRRRAADLKVFERRVSDSFATNVAAGRNYLPDWAVRAGLVSGQKQEGVKDLRVRDARGEMTGQEEFLTFIAGLVSLSSP